MENQNIQQPEKTKKKHGCLIGIAIAVGVIILICIIAALSSGGGNKTTTSGNGSSAVSTVSSVKTWPEGQYKVGTDLKAGEYVLIASEDLCYVEVSKDSTGNLDSIIANDNFANRSYVTVTAGQYLKTTGCTMYAAADAPKVDTSKGTLPSGMYKVGTDLKAGEYSVTSDAGSSSSYIEVSKDSSHNLNAVTSNDNFSGKKYITVKDGQYLKLQDATLKLK